MRATNATNKGKANPFQQFRQRLEEKSEELRTQMGNPVAHPVLQIHLDPYDTADWAEKSHEEWIFLQKNNFERTLLREVEEAKERLREGTYGTCQDCVMPISRKRLEAVPWARYCVSCQERRQTGNN